MKAGSSKKEQAVELDFIQDLTEFDYKYSELVFAFVYPVGTDFSPIREKCERLLRAYSYKTIHIRLSDHLEKYKFRLPQKPEHERIRSRMNAGNTLCARYKSKDYLALAAVADIAIRRAEESKVPQARPKTAYILSSLKRPDEVSLLRKIYGDGFYLIGIFASKEERTSYLLRKNAPKNQVERLIEDDELEVDDYGQKTSLTFPLSDLFITSRTAETDLKRFLRVLFCDPYTTPTEDERGMFLAYAASLRSAQLGRQVGACIATDFGSVVSVGANEVPRYGGGLYWPGKGDKRDHILKYDSNDKEISRIGNKILNSLEPYLTKSKKPNVQAILADALDITEYGRAVHAEMDALITCARTGTCPQGGTMYTTTFPCHNCTRHIITSGLKRVVYIEPYAKSHALELHSDTVKLDLPREGGSISKSKVLFQPFVGIGPRKFFDLFSLNMSSGYRLERKRDGEVLNWERKKKYSLPRIAMHPNSYIVREQQVLGKIRQLSSKI